MPFQSKRQMRAAFGGHIPGISKEKAKEWAKETPDLKDLPDRAPAEKGQPTLLSKEAQTVNKRLLDAIDAAGVPIAAFPRGFRDDAAAAYVPKFLGPVQEYIRNHVLTQPGVNPSTANNLKDFLHMRPGGVHFYDGLAGALHERPGVVAHEFGHAVAEKKFPNVAKAEAVGKILFGGKVTAPIAGFIAGASTGEDSSKTREVATPLLTAAATGLPLISSEGQAWYHGLGPLRQAGGDVANYHNLNLGNLVRQAAPVMYRGALGYGAGRLTRAAVDTLRKPKQDAVEAKQAALAHSSDSGAGLSSKAVRRGQKVEREHTADPATARQIAIDHLRERPDYYARLAEAEKSASRSGVNPSDPIPLNPAWEHSPFGPSVHERLHQAAEAAGIPIHVKQDLNDGAEAFYSPLYNRNGTLPHGLHYKGGRTYSDPAVIAHEMGHAVDNFKNPRLFRTLGLANRIANPFVAAVPGLMTGQDSSWKREILTPLATVGLGTAPIALQEGLAWHYGTGLLRRAGGHPHLDYYHGVNRENLLGQAKDKALGLALGYAGGRAVRAASDYMDRRRAAAAAQPENATVKGAEKQSALSSKEISKNLFDTIEAAGVPLKYVSPEALPEGVFAAYMPKYVQDSLSPADLKEVSDAGFTFGGIHLPGAAAQKHFNPSILAHEFGHAVAERKYPRVAKAEQAANDFVTGGAGSLLSLGAGLATGRNSSTAREVLTPLGIMAAAALPLAVTEGQAWYHGLAPLRQAGGNAMHYHAVNLGNLASQAAVPAVATGISYGLGRGTRYLFDRAHGPKEKEVGNRLVEHSQKQAAFSPTAIRALQHGGIGAGAGALIGAGAGAAGADPSQRGRGALKGALAGAGIGFAGGAGGSLLHNRISTPTATAPVAKGINAVSPTSPTMPAIGPRPYGPLPGAKFPQRTGAFNVTDPSELYHLEQQGWKLGPKDVLYPPGQNRFRTDAITNRFTEPPVKIAVNADFIRTKAVQGLAKRGLPLDGKAQAEIANKAIKYVRAKAQSPEEARKARDALRETLGKFKGQVPKSRPKDYGAPRQGGAWAGVGRSSDLLDSAGARLALVLGNMGAEAGKAYLSGKQDTESKALKKQLRAAQRAEFTGAPRDTSADRAKHRAIFTGVSALQGGLSGGYAGGAFGPLVGADPNKAMAAGALLGALAKGSFGYLGYGREEKKLEDLRSKIRKAQSLQKESADVSELEARLNQMQAEKAHEDRISAVANHFDHLGLGILASPYIADAAEKATRNLMLRGGKLGRVGAELHTGADAAKHFLHAHPLLVEGGGLALVAPGVTHRLAKAVDHFRPGSHQPMAPSVPEQPTAVSDMRAASSAAEKVGRLLAHPAPQEKVAINLPNTLAGAAGAAWKNKKTLAGIGAVGAVGAGLYGAKKGIDAAHKMVTHEHGPARYVGVPPGMQPPAPAYMPIGS